MPPPPTIYSQPYPPAARALHPFRGSRSRAEAVLAFEVCRELLIAAAARELHNGGERRAGAWLWASPFAAREPPRWISVKWGVGGAAARPVRSGIPPYPNGDLTAAGQSIPPYPICRWPIHTLPPI